MPLRLVRPELAPRDLLNANVEANFDCLFAVAYIDLAGVNTLRDALAARLRRKRFRLRILFRATDCRTEPAALDELLGLARKAQGTLSLRYSRHPKFHAKAFGFRRTKTGGPVVVLGSANLLGAALSADSGEPGLMVEQSAVADEAWDVLEDFWAEGQRVTPAWLAAYRNPWASCRGLSQEQALPSVQ